MDGILVTIGCIAAEVVEDVVEDSIVASFSAPVVDKERYIVAVAVEGADEESTVAPVSASVIRDDEEIVVVAVVDVDEESTEDTDVVVVKLFDEDSTVAPVSALEKGIVVVAAELDVSTVVDSEKYKE